MLQVFQNVANPTERIENAGGNESEMPVFRARERSWRSAANAGASADKSHAKRPIDDGERAHLRDRGGRSGDHGRISAGSLPNPRTGGSHWAKSRALAKAARISVAPSVSAGRLGFQRGL